MDLESVVKVMIRGYWSEVRGQRSRVTGQWSRVTGQGSLVKVKGHYRSVVKGH